VLAVALLASAARGEDLRQKLRAAAGRGDLAGAETIAEAMVARDPGDAMAAFDLARVRAARGRTADALGALQQAAERGFYYRATLARAAVLDPVRELAGFADVIARVEANAAEQLRRFEQGPARKARVVHHDAPSTATRPLPLIVGLHPSGGSAAQFAPLLRSLARERGAQLVLP
jgi:hypothetical protein